jgi:hypothetical protein
MAYLNVTEVESGVKGLAKAYKALTELISLPNVTHEGRTSHALRIGTGSAASKDGGLSSAGSTPGSGVPVKSASILPLTSWKLTPRGPA